MPSTHFSASSSHVPSPSAGTSCSHLPSILAGSLASHHDSHPGRLASHQSMSTGATTTTKHSMHKRTKGTGSAVRSSTNSPYVRRVHDITCRYNRVAWTLVCGASAFRGVPAVPRHGRRCGCTLRGQAWRADGVSSVAAAWRQHPRILQADARLPATSCCRKRGLRMPFLPAARRIFRIFSPHGLAYCRWFCGTAAAGTAW